MKSILLTAFTTFFLFTATEARAITHFLSGPMDVFQATTNPNDVGNGTGTISGDYDAGTMTLNYSITWQNLTTAVTNAHFHVGAPGVPGGVGLGIPGPWASPQIGSNIALDATQESDLLSGNWYVNIHTSMFGGGEIRGQVLVAQIPEPASAGLAAVAMVSMIVLNARRKIFRNR